MSPARTPTSRRPNTNAPHPRCVSLGPRLYNPRRFPDAIFPNHRLGAPPRSVPPPLLAQSAQKKPLTQADWDRWRSINNPTLSNDGKWDAYTLQPQVGDGEFVVRATSGATE